MVGDDPDGLADVQSVECEDAGQVTPTKKRKRAKSRKKSPLPSAIESAPACGEDGQTGRNTDEQDVESERGTETAASTQTSVWYVVRGAPHLGLGLKLGCIYSASDLTHRCRGSISKLQALAHHLQNTEFFEEVGEPPQGEDHQKKRKRGRDGCPLSDLASNCSDGPKRPPEKEIKFITHQVVWYTPTQPHRPAKITMVTPELSAPYHIRFIDAPGAAEGDDGEIFAKSSELRAWAMSDIQALLPTETGVTSTSITENTLAGGEQSPMNFPAGKEIWICEQQPACHSFPARVVEGIAWNSRPTFVVEQLGSFEREANHGDNQIAQHTSTR